MKVVSTGGSLLTHGSVPDDSLAVSKASLDIRKCLWSDVKSHPALLDTVNVNHLWKKEKRERRIRKERT